MLLWDIWRRNRGIIVTIAGLCLCGFLLKCLLAGAEETERGREWRLTISVFLMIGSILLVFATFNYTEWNLQKGWTGFPYRLFTVPVPTFLLVFLPMFLGVVAVEVVFWFWAKLLFTQAELKSPGWIAIVLGSFMPLYQFLLWAAAGFRFLRLILLGFFGTAFIGIGCLPTFLPHASSKWLTEGALSRVLIAVAVATFLGAWICVSRQRCGGGRRQNWLVLVIDWASDRLPRYRKDFSSPAQAQFWFEWRRSGYVLPLGVGALLLGVIAPLSWTMRIHPDITLWILAWTLATPIILALPIGKGFSKPDFWSRDLSIPAFTAVRPLASEQIVATKLKVAALSVFISWLFVLVFLAVWFSNWADLSSLAMVRLVFWMVQGHSVHPQLIMAALLFLAAMFITWKFLVGGLWIGLSGNRRLFIGSGVIYLVSVLAVLFGVAILINQESPVHERLRWESHVLLSAIQAFAAAAVIAKFWLTARSWRLAQSKSVLLYLLAWLPATLSVIVLALMLWADGTLILALMAFLDLPPLDPLRLRHLLLLMALLLIPFARIGLAGASHAGNRHG